MILNKNLRLFDGIQINEEWEIPKLIKTSLLLLRVLALIPIHVYFMPTTIRICMSAPVFRIRIRIRIHMFLGLPDPAPDPLVRDMDPDPDPALDPDPDPSTIMQK